MSFFSKKPKAADAAVLTEMVNKGADSAALNKSLGGPGSRNRLKMIVNSNEKLKGVISRSGRAWNNAIDAAKVILNAAPIPPAKKGPDGKNIGSYGSFGSKEVAEANAKAVAAAEARAAAPAAGGGRYKTRRSRKKTKKTRKTRGRKH